MTSLIVPVGVRRKINGHVDRILQDLDKPEPPLDLNDVLALLELDLAYYQGTSDSFFHQTIHRLTMAGKQVLARPALLFEALAKFSIKALYVPDRKRILIDENLAKIKHRWATGHEVAHHILPWHTPALRGDNELTIKESCRQKVEAEANYGSGQLLFLRERFTEEALGSEPSIELVQTLAKSFRNTHSSTLWRLVEAVGTDRPILGMIHPHPLVLPDTFDAKQPCRHFIRSDAFVRSFSNIEEVAVYNQISGLLRLRKGGIVGRDTILLSDANGEMHEFSFETFRFHHDCLTLALHLRKAPVSVFIEEASW